MLKRWPFFDLKRYQAHSFDDPLFGSHDEEGEIDVYFLPIRPGKYDFYVENYRESGMLGQIIVK